MRAIYALLRALADGIASRSSFGTADRDPATDVTDNEITTGKIALAHLNKFPDYYTRLAQMKPKPNRSWHRATDWIV